LYIFLLAAPIAAQQYSFDTDEPAIVSRSAVVLDAVTGTVVYAKNPNEVIQPASLTKLMTMHIVFGEIARGKASLDEIISPPRESWAVNQPPRSSLLLLANGQQLSIRELLLGLAIHSGNDAAVALALRFAPSVQAFADMMNHEAQQLGLVQTHFVEPSGVSPFNMTTAQEFAYFCRTYLQLWQYSLGDYHSVRDFSYPNAWNVPEQYRGNPRTRTQRNRNALLDRVPGVDGLKTGYIDDSGYNIALTAERGGTRFIAVILGAPSGLGGDKIRDEDGRQLLEWAFSRYATIRPLMPELEPFRVWKGKENYVSITAGEPLEFTAALGRGALLSWRVETPTVLSAPLPEGSPAGILVFYDSSGDLKRVPLLTSHAVERGGFFKRLFDSIRLFFLGGRATVSSTFAPPGSPRDQSL